MVSPCDCGRHRTDGLEGIAQTAALQSFSTTALQSGSKELVGLFSSMRRHDEFPAKRQPRHPERKVPMRRMILAAALLCASQTAFAQELTAEQRSACMGDYEKY